MKFTQRCLACASFTENDSAVARFLEKGISDAVDVTSLRLFRRSASESLSTVKRYARPAASVLICRG
jgi:hypothetical protein